MGLISVSAIVELEIQSLTLNTGQWDISNTFHFSRLVKFTLDCNRRFGLPGVKVKDLASVEATALQAFSIAKTNDSSKSHISFFPKFKSWKRD